MMSLFHLPRADELNTSPIQGHCLLGNHHCIRFAEYNSLLTGVVLYTFFEVLNSFSTDSYVFHSILFFTETL